MALSLNQDNKLNSLDLSLYNEIKELTAAINKPNKTSVDMDYVVKVSRNEIGSIDKINYYNKENVLEKSAIYNGSELSRVKVFHKSYAYVEENWQDSLLKSKDYYDENDNKLYSVEYTYSQGRIVQLTKKIDDYTFVVAYTYDEFGRVNGRTVYENNVTLAVQSYKYDVIDRITEYEDCTKKLYVWKMSANNELLSYSIVDKNGKERVITNSFENGSYKNSEISMNNVKRSAVDVKYADNIVLKRPTASEEDLNMVRALYSKKN